MAKAIPPGGPAAINGFLYQILSNLGHVARSLDPVVVALGAPLGALTVVLEPRAGDARYSQAGARTLVDQYKTRSSGGTWSLRSIVEDVLPDLLKAVEPGMQADYRFVTDGREGRWEELRRICGELRLEDSQSEPGSTLDDVIIRTFFNSPSSENASAAARCSKDAERKPWEYPTTDAEFFEYVARRLQPKGLPDTIAHAALVRQLLANLSLVALETQDQLIADIDALLSRIVAHTEDVPSKRAELCGRLLSKSAIGGAEITAIALLAEAGLHEAPLRDLVDWTRRCATSVNTTLAALAYDPKKDVRSMQALTTIPVTILSGESGMGKTWALCAMALEMLARSKPAVLVWPQADSRTTLQAISDAIWLEGRGMDAPLELVVVHRRLLESIPNADALGSRGESLCTIFLDDVQTTNLGVELARQIGRSPGFRLVVSAPEQVAGALHSRLGPQRSRLIRLPRLSSAELRDLLHRSDLSYEDLPAEIRDTLKLPVLARLYCEIGVGNSFVPESEYALFKGYYEKVWTWGEQPEHPEDLIHLLQLVLHTVRGATSYPWSVVHEALQGSRARLQRIGLLRLTPGAAHVEIWHDRVFNWFVAEALVSARRHTLMRQEELVSLLTQMYSNELGPAGRRLGYVPMDYLWLTLGVEVGSDQATDDAIAVAKALEALPPDHGYPEVLYEGLLPTLGARAVPIYFQRLLALDPESRRDAAIYPVLARGLIRLSQGSPTQVAALIPAWLEHANDRLVEVAVELAVPLPDARLLEALWSVHMQLDQRIELLDRESSGQERFRLVQVKQRCVEALRRSASLSTTWLRDKFGTAASGIELVELGYVLVGVDKPLALQVWMEVKDRLFTELPSTRRRVFALCVREFRDKAESLRLIEWLGQSDDSVGEAAFAALAYVDPDAAVQHIGTAIGQTRFTSSWWAPLLLQTRRAQTLEKLLEIMGTGQGAMHAVLESFHKIEDEIDDGIWNFALDKLQERLAADLNADLQNNPGGYSSLLTATVRGDSANLLRLLRDRAGSLLETYICRLAIARLDRLDDFPNRRDTVMHEAIHLLQRIAGCEFGRFVVAALRHPSHTARVYGIANAMHCDSHDVRCATLQLARTAATGAGDESAEAYRFALASMLQLGDLDAVVDLCLNSSHVVSPQLLSWLRPAKASAALLPFPATSAHMLDPVNGANAIVAAGVHGGAASLSMIHNALKHLDRNSELAKFAVLTLYTCGKSDSGLHQVCVEMLSTAENCHFAINCLLQFGDDEAFSNLLLHFSADSALEVGREQAWEVLLQLLDSSLGEQAAEILASWYEQGRKPVGPSYLKHLPRLDVHDAHEMLLELALADTGWADRSWSALQGLFEIDREAALGAAQQMLSKRPLQARRTLPRQLVQLGGAAFLALLCEHAIREEDAPTRAQIGRSLRGLDSSAVGERLMSMLDSASKTTRLRGIELAAWQPANLCNTTLQRIAEDDPEPEVRNAAVTACRRQRSEALTVELIALVKDTQDASVRPGLIDALLQRVDPFVAAIEDDPQFALDLLDSHASKLNFSEQLKLRRRKELTSS